LVNVGQAQRWELLRNLFRGCSGPKRSHDTIDRNTRSADPYDAMLIRVKRNLNGGRLERHETRMANLTEKTRPIRGAKSLVCFCCAARLLLLSMYFA
jgi:hypothetical protein